MDLTEEFLDEWLQQYFLAWQSNDPEDIIPLFAEDAIYWYGPFKEPAQGRETIVANWIANPAQQKDVKYQFEILATKNDTGVAHWNVNFRTEAKSSVRYEMDGILLLKFNSEKECTEHREWYVEKQTELNKPD